MSRSSNPASARRARTVAADKRSTVRPFFEAESVVVIGASTDPAKTSGKTVAYLRRYGYAGQVGVVNPNRDDVAGFSSVRRVSDLPFRPELAIVALPAPLVQDALHDATEAGVQHAIVFANGFADASNFRAQAGLAHLAEESGLRVLGPNCLGAVNMGNMLTATFSTLLGRKAFHSGSLGLVTQSGAVGNAVMLSLQARRVGISHWVATGNELDVGALECALYLVADPRVRVLGLFLESVKDFSLMPELSRRAKEAGKPIIVLKAGRGERSRRAAQSHTGKVVGDYGAWPDLAEQFGLVRVETLSEFTAMAEATSVSGLTRRGQGLAILCGSGGIGTIVSDACDRHGLAIAELSHDVKMQLKALLPAAAGLENPIDPTPVSDQVFYTAAQLLLADDSVSELLIVINSLARDYEVAFGKLMQLAEFCSEAGKQLAVSYFSPHDCLSPEAESDLAKAGAIVLPTPEDVVRVLTLVPSRGDDRDGATKLDSEIEGTSAGSQGDTATHSTLGLVDLLPDLVEYSLPIVGTKEVISVRAAQEAVADVGGPTVMKLEIPDVPHKTESGYVRLGISTGSEAALVFTEFSTEPGFSDGRVLVQPEIREGLEVLIGCTRDPEFGPVISVGVGGVLAELIGEISTAGLPLTDESLKRLTSAGKLGRLLRGYRGSEERDSAAMSEVIRNVSRFFLDHPLLHELELNPLIVRSRGEGVLVVDALATVKDAR